MIERTVFYTRLAVCKACPFWRGACLKGHVLQGTLGCPLKKFEGVQGVGYMDDLPVPEAPAITCCDESVPSEITPMSWGEVCRHLLEAMARWRQGKFAVLTGEPYKQRIRTCLNCPGKQYQWFQCKHCCCVIYTKAKLATEECPLGYWPKS